MNTITIFPENPKAPGTQLRAVAGEKQSVGATAGAALDALTAQLGDPRRPPLSSFSPSKPIRFSPPSNSTDSPS
jgi:hypothetical protein